MNAYGEQPIDPSEQEKVKKLVVEIVEQLQHAINKPNFWKVRESEIKKLQGELDDMLDFCGIDAVSSNHERVGTEILNLAKKRHQELTGEK